MSLIKCPECKNLISDFASICPQCGLPFSHYEKYGFKYNDFLIKDSVLMKYRGKDTKVVLFDGVNEIGQDAFFYFSDIESIIIPNGVTKLCKSAFGGCTSLKEIKLPDSLITIGESSFSNCKSLTNITIPNNVTSIDKYAFECCSSLNSIVIPKSVTSIGASAFWRCSSLTIYCEAESKPAGWDEDWNFDNRTVVWGFNGETTASKNK